MRVLKMKKTMRAWIIIWVAALVFIGARESSAALFSSISGRVIAEDTGEGVEGITVNAVFASGEVDRHLPRFHAETDVNGLYVFERLEPGLYYMSIGDGQARYISESFNVEYRLPAGKNLVDINFVARLAGGVAGTVYGADGVTPQSGVDVTVHVPGQPSEVRNFDITTTDNNGAFVLKGLPPSDTAVITIFHPGLATIRKVFKVIGGKTTEGVNLVIDWNDITGVSGYIKSYSGKPIAFASVYLSDANGNRAGDAMTDETGRYSLVGLEPGIYSMEAYDPDMEVWLVINDIVIKEGESTEFDLEMNISEP
jgi:hypothetical protein